MLYLNLFRSLMKFIIAIHCLFIYFIDISLGYSLAQGYALLFIFVLYYIITYNYIATY